METGTCYIVGAGEFTARNLNPGKGDLVIAADGGYAYLKAAGKPADFLVGDFDSLKDVPDDMDLIRHPVEKDDTDMGLAIGEGIRRGYSSFRLYGAGGGRIDHFIANLQLIADLSRSGIRAEIVCPEMDVFAVTDGSLLLPARRAGTLISVFCHGDRAEGVTLRGLKYSLNEANLTAFHPLGVSNEFTGEAAEISVRHGTLIVFGYADCV
ncbi:MAG: thiamine diphosphokinase [Clostridiales bacterium]|nr:thiamine diphosphokinase [Clostridiales bacterium]